MPRINGERAECINPEENQSLPEDCWIWEYGIILQEDPEPIPGGKRCVLFPEPREVLLPDQGGSVFTLYYPFENYHLKLPFNARSIVVFKKPSNPIPDLAQGVILYEGEGFNKVGVKKKREETISKFTFFEKLFKVFAQTEEAELGLASFRPQGEDDVKIVSPQDLKNVSVKKEPDPDRGIEGLHHNTRSIKFDPTRKKGGGFLAVLLGKDEGCSGTCGDERYKVCEVRTEAVGDLATSPIGQCGRCTGIFKFFKLADCYPCLEKLYVIKGIKQ